MDSLIAKLDALDAEPWSQETYEKKRGIVLELLAGATREGVERALRYALPMQMRAATIRAVLLDEHDPFSQPFPDNPWGITPHHDLVDAIDHVWDLFDAPKLTQAMLERVMGLVLIDDGGVPLLGYLHVHELESFEIDGEYAKKAKPPFDRRHAKDWLPFGSVTMSIGRAPSEATTSKYGHTLFEPLRRLYRVHAGIFDTMWGLSGPDDLLPWNRMLEHDPPRNVSDENEPIRSDELLYFFGYGDDRSDLFDIRDPEEWLVVAWGEGHLYDNKGTPLAEWLDEQTSLILHMARE